MLTKHQLVNEAQSAFAPDLETEKEAQKFLEAYPWLLKTELDSGLFTDFSRQRLYTQITLPNLKRPDLIRREWTPSEGWVWEFIELEPSGSKPLNQNLTYSARLNSALTQIRQWQAYADSNVTAMQELFPGFSPPLFGRVVIGRSELFGRDQRDIWKRVRKESRYVTVRTYTWLMEKALSLPEWIVEREGKNGAAGTRDDLLSDRQDMEAIESRPFARSFDSHVEFRVTEIRNLVTNLLESANRHEYPRASATALEGLVLAVLPKFAPEAGEIRELAHDLDNREPNVSRDELLRQLQGFLQSLPEMTAQDTRSKPNGGR